MQIRKQNKSQNKAAAKNVQVPPHAKEKAEAEALAESRAATAEKAETEAKQLLDEDAD